VLKAPLKSKALKVRMFDAACISILLYGCETWVLTSELENKLNVFARKAYRIMLDINQADEHLTNKELYRITGQRPISETIRLRQLQFTGHCLRMPPDEPANIYSIYKSNTRDVGKRGRPDKIYLDQIAEYLSESVGGKPNADEITKWAKTKEFWKKLVVAPNKPAR
jgi:hypothetical protein